MKKLVFVLAILLSASVARAQSVPTATWNQAEPPVTAQTFTYTLKIDAAAPISLVTTCSLVNNTTQCTAPVPGYVPAVHTVVLTASNAFGSSSGTFTTGAPPSNPTGFTITVTTTTTTVTTVAK